jgi:hypothetical protein
MKALTFLLTPALCLAQFTTVTCAGDGSTDVTACINNILAPPNDLVFFPKAAVCYKITEPLTLHSGQTIMGAMIPGSGSVGGICSYNTSADALYAPSGNARNITIENMLIYDAVSTTRTAGAAIHIDGTGTGDAAKFDIHDNQTIGFYDSVSIEETLNSSIAGNRFDTPLRDGVHQTQPSTSTGFYHNYVDTPQRYCYYISALVYSTFDSNACDHAGSDGYHFDATSTTIRAIVLNANGVETATGNGMYLDGQSFTVNSPIISGVASGMADILVIGSNIHIANAYLRDGKYGISLPNPPLHGGSSTSVIVTNPYFLGQATGSYYDPNGLIQKPF